MMLRSSSSPILASMEGATRTHENKLPTSNTTFTNGQKLLFHHDPPSLSQHMTHMHRSSSAGTLNAAASMTDEAGQDSPVRFSDKCIIRPTCHNKFKPAPKLEPIPSFSAYDKDEIECKEGEEDDEEFSFPALGGHDPDIGEVNKIGVFRSLRNLYGRGSYFSSSLENQSPWPSPSALYMATGLGIDHPPAMNKLNKIDDERLQQHYEKIIKEDPCNPLVLRNYARYLHETKKDYNKAEEFYSRAILAGPDDGEVLSEYASLSWEINRDENMAFDCFQRAIQLSPENSHVLAAYASFLWESGEGDADQDMTTPANYAVPNPSSQVP